MYKIYNLKFSKLFYRFSINFYNNFFGRSEIINNDNSTIYTSTDNMMLILFTLNHRNSTFISAKLNYSTYSLSSCPNEIKINDNNGIILSPQIDTNYYCSLKINVNNNETIGFNIETLISPIKHDRIVPIKFTTNYFRLFKELHGNRSNINIGISTNVNLEMMQSLTTTQNLKINFKINYKRNPCGGLYQLNDNFTISLPLNLSITYGRIDCAWQLKKSYGAISTFNLTGKFNLINQDCNKEYITIHNGIGPNDAEIKRICNNDINFTYTVNRGFIYIYYHSDEYSSNSNFEIKTIPTTKCGGIINAGGFNNRNYRIRDIQFDKTDYKNNQECIWEYFGRDGYTTEIEFYGRFFIEDSIDCKKDYLDILHYENNDWKLLLHTCGRILPQKFNTTKSKIRFIFRTDDNNIGDGFNIHFTRYCGGIYDVTNDIQKISLSNYYSYLINCNYTFISKTDDLILINFKEFDLDSSEDCSLASMDVYKEANLYYYDAGLEYQKIGKFCNRNSIKEVRGRGRIVLYLNGYNLGNLPKFSIEYSHEKCGGNITNPKELQIISNKKNPSIIEELDCIWYIIAPQNKIISIKFKYLNINDNYNCYTDYISIYSTNITNDENLKAKLCGDLTKEHVHLKINNNNGILVRKSDDSIDEKGFIALIDFIDNCDQTIYLTEQNSTYRLTRFAGSYTNKLDCDYLFKSPQDYNIKIEFHQFNLSSCKDDNNNNDDDDCKCDYIEIRDGDTSLSELIGQYCGQRIPPSHISILHQLFIKFVTDDALTSTGFDATIHLVKTDCGIQINEIEEKVNNISKF